jgi:hypothetical protein
MNDLTDAKIIDLISPASQLYKLYCSKTKLKNCLTTDLAHDIEASMPIGLSNKDGRIFLIKLVSHTFPEKSAHQNYTDNRKQEDTKTRALQQKKPLQPYFTGEIHSRSLTILKQKSLHFVA